ncbi:MAG: hypothetical protein KAJ18_02525 [Candidatus Omnitrophica bacterium]|nr:hypothetical protein [Candidatus Omnitrophota bacterium]
MLWTKKIRSVLYIISCILLISSGIISFAFAKPPKAKRDPDFMLTACHEKKLGVEILCDPEWEVQHDEKGISFDIRKTFEATVKATISKSKESGITLDDLTPSALQYVYDYADGFKFARVYINRQGARRIEAKLATDTNKYLMDFFLVHDSTHYYRISFSVIPKRKAYKYRELFIALAKSFRFAPSEQPVDNK